MAAIDLERGLEHRGRGWGQERPELMDNFDSEMQEWEDQLQDIQKKIEELYSEVQARRGGNDIAPDDRKSGTEMECGLGHRGNGLFDVPDHHSKAHRGDRTGPSHYGNGCSYSGNGYSYPVRHQNGYGYNDRVSEIGEFLQDYLDKGTQMSRKNQGTRHVRFSDTIKVSQDATSHQDDSKTRSGNERFGPGQFSCSFEEAENRKNRVSHMKTPPCKESSPSRDSSGAKPPTGQRDVPASSLRSNPQFPSLAPDSPALDRKTFTPGVLGDRKCSSPSVLRKFGAMLQENEGKTLTETGVVTQQGANPEPKCPTPGCQRRALGASTAASRAPVRVPTQKCQADSDVLTAGTEPGQERGLALDCGRQNNKDQRGGYNGSKGLQPSPQQSQRRSQVMGSPKIRPRSNSGSDRDVALGTRKPVDNRVSSSSPGPQRIQRDEGLIELLDMLEIQHEYRAGHSQYRQDQQQVNPPEQKKSFSRPARPANQRPPSRWANRNPSASISAPSGPMYRPPSPLNRPPSPMTRTPSPSLKQRPHISYSLQTETIIM